MRIAVLFAVAAVVLTSGCASIVSGVNQPVSVVAKSPENVDVAGAKCTLTNSKGEWYTTTPGSVVVHRAYGNMLVNCVHPTYAGVTSVKSVTKPMAFGNIIFGGVIGAGIDMGNGSAYDYPDMISVSMSASNVTPISAVESKPLVLAQTAVPSSPPAPLSPPLPTSPPSLASPVTPPSMLLAPLVLPVQQEAKVGDGLKGGQDAFNAERLARTQSCSAGPRAVMTGKGPGFETYSVACESGDALSMRCEFGSCRILR